MSDSLDRRLARLRGRLRRMLALRGLCWAAFAAAAGFLAVTWTDWLVPLAWDVRLAALAGLGALLAVVLWREVVRPLGERLDDLRLATIIERHWPALNDRLSSTIAFLRAGPEEEARLGSSTLREATIARTLDEVERLDFGKVVDPRPIRLAATMAAWTIAVLVAETIAAPEFQAIAARRFLLGNQAWPKRTELAITAAPEKIARGMPYELAAEAGVGSELPVVPPRLWFDVLGHAIPPLKLLEGSLRGRTPGSARVTYAYEDGEKVSMPLRPDEDGVFHGRLDVVNQPFRFYVEAGDDATPWFDVAVVPPPTLDAVQVRLEPPSYTMPYATDAERAEAVETLADDRTQLRVLEGTVVRFDATANKPLAEAVLMRDERPADLPVTLDGVATGLAATVPAEAPGSFWFALTDTDGFPSPEATRYELRTITDAEPSATIVDPPFDVSVPPTAVVPVAIRAEDDYGLQLIRLVSTIGGVESAEEEEQVVPLWASEATIDAGRAREQQAAYRFDLAALGVEPGALITAYAEARDFYSAADGAEGPHISRSRALRIRVIADEEFRRQLDEQRSEIRDEIQRIADMQKLAIPPVRDAITDLDTSGRVDEATGDDLREASVMQRQVSSRIEESGSGLTDRIQRFLDDLENARVDDPEIAEQMEQMKAALDRIRSQNLRPAEQGIGRALNDLESRPSGDQQPAGEQGEQGQQAPSAPSESGDSRNTPSGEPSEPGAPPEPGEQGAVDREDGTKGSLQESRENQQEIARELDAMLEGLRQFETLRGVTRDAEQLLNKQDEVMKAAQEKASDPGLMGRSADRLSNDQQSDLQNLADQQRDVAGELQDLTGRMAEMAEQMAEDDPLAAEALNEALEQLRDQGTSGKLGQAAEQIGRNQMGAAGQGQQQAREDLQELVDSLKNRRENDLERLVKQLEETRDQLAQMRQQQADLLKQTRDAQRGGQQGGEEQEQRLQELAKQQEQLRQELQRQIQKLRKLRADAAARSGSKAASRMGQAGQELEEGEGGQAQQEEEEALNDLDQAVADTDEAIQEAKDRLLMEQFARIGDQLRAFNERQQRILEETEAFDERREAEGGRLSRADSFDVRNLGNAQEGLKGETDSLTERLDGAPVFRLALERAVGRMDEAAGGLKQVETGDPTQDAERDASRWLDQLVASLNPDPDGDEQNGQQGQQGQQGGQQGGQQAGDGIPAEAQIRMLKTMQELINARTTELDEVREREDALGPDQELELVRLEEDQRMIADLLRDLINPRRPDGLED